MAKLEKEIDKIRHLAGTKILYTHHATAQMNLDERLISTKEVREVIEKGKIIECRPDDSRGPTFLFSGETSKNRTLHVVCSPKDEFLAIITAYVPDPAEWSADFSKRKKS
ncbi:MAG: DUF4258 domain-containing protein [Candidatus Cloacimonetes bacterium]|nr:DUF4258 domain-containing protein [Candidatus Cloacimonadota bacterium]